MVAECSSSMVPTSVGDLVDLEREVDALVDDGGGLSFDVQQRCNSAPPTLEGLLMMTQGRPTSAEQEPSSSFARSRSPQGYEPPRYYLAEEEPQRSMSTAGLPSHPAMSCRAFEDVADTEYMPQQTQRSRSPYLSHYIESNLPASASCSNLADDDSNIAAGMSALSLSKTRSLNGENVVHCQFSQQFTSHSGSSFDIPHQREHYLHQSNMGKPYKEFCNNPPLSITASEELYRTNRSQSQFVKNIPRFPANGQTHLADRSSSNNVYSKLRTSQPGSVGRSTLSHISEADFGWSNMNGHLVNQRLPGNINNQLDAGASFRGSMEAQYLARRASLSGSGSQVPLMNSPYSQYLQRLQLGALSTRNIDDPEERNFRPISRVHAKYRKALIEPFLAQQKLQHVGAPFLGIPGLNGNAALGLPSPYPTSFISSLRSENYLRQNEQLARFPSSGKYPNRGFLGSCTTESGKTNFNSSLLEVYSGNNNIRIELSDIMDCIVELSSDQYGSRFIQQKLENASSEEKNKVFPTILPYALELMTDVFGNYVIQKFFEKGTKSQRGQLATQITGHVLPLSLQMYGCRVIQKALELLDEDQQTQMVSELDGSVMKCVRDQNGNHVIQKCIECVPKERTEFIISSFYGQVASLSTHPYGCRVIQRILERFHDGQTKSKMMSEILQSACALAQDQYGNYVIQHVLQHGEQSGRSAIIKELSGEIVKMSQQKYASNVIEKCLIVANPEERQLLIDEILGCSEGNESLQVMMKDQYANYVVQRVLETCDDRNRQLILSLIRVHLNSLKMHTYVKHIIARVEKLITAGERHMKISSGLWGGMEQFS